MKMFELLPRPLGSIFRKLTHLTCNSRSSSWSLGEYAVSIRSDLRSAATSTLGLFFGILGEYAVSTRSDLRSTANYAKAPVRSETEAKPCRSQ